MPDANSTLPLPQYRTISPWAIAALLGGCAAGLAMVNVILLAIPLIGIFLALTALNDIRKNREITSGVGIAYIGLFLSLFMLVFAPVRIALRMSHMRTYAETLGNKTLQLMQEGRFYEVHHLTTRQFVGHDPNRSLAEYYAETPKLNETYLRFIDNDAPKKLADLNREFEFQQEEIVSTAGTHELDGFVIRYRVSPTKSVEGPFKVWVAMERRYHEATHEAVWWLRGLYLNDPAKRK